ncbi:hypothetical protein HDV04_000104 [Boothiomyces sp. JEL0838]|nr:hypothetical protein HDV04_000104 [Boothiomyces sp. JEL0838]
MQNSTFPSIPFEQDQNTLFDDSEKAFFSEFLDGLMDGPTSASYSKPISPFSPPLPPVEHTPFDSTGGYRIGETKLQDARLQHIQMNNYAALGIIPARHVAPSAEEVKQGKSDQENKDNRLSPPSSNSSMVNATVPKKRGPGRPRKNQEEPNKKVALAGMDMKPKRSTALAIDTNIKKRLEEDEENHVKKPARRDLLTEDEKRVNHVVSEQRRRKLIREGFQVLVDLTPALSNSPPVSSGPGNTGGGHSKSTILFKAADYIRELKAQVESLTNQLHGVPMNPLPTPQSQIQQPAYTPQKPQESSHYLMHSSFQDKSPESQNIYSKAAYSTNNASQQLFQAQRQNFPPSFQQSQSFMQSGNHNLHNLIQQRMNNQSNYNSTFSDQSNANVPPSFLSTAGNFPSVPTETPKFPSERAKEERSQESLDK